MLRNSSVLVDALIDVATADMAGSPLRVCRVLLSYSRQVIERTVPATTSKNHSAPHSSKKDEPSGVLCQHPASSFMLSIAAAKCSNSSNMISTLIVFGVFVSLTIGRNPLPRAFEQVLVESELRRFVATHVDRAVERHQAWLRTQPHDAGDVCLEATSGRVLRHRCCVYSSNLAMAMLHFRYSVGEALAAFDQLPGASLDVMMRMFAVVNAERSGVYALPLVLSRGVPGTLVKCEFGDVHTFLVFRSERLDDIIIDVSYRQFLLLMDQAAEADVERGVALGLFAQYAPTYVGSEAGLVEGVLNVTRLAERHRRLEALHEPAFSATTPFLAQLFSQQMRDSLCGRAVQQQQTQQQR